MYNPLNKQNFIPRLASDAVDRAKNVRDTYARLIADKKSVTAPVEAAWQTVGQGAGLINDTVGEAVRSGYRVLPQAIRKPIENTGQYIIKTPVGQAGLGMVQKLAQKLQAEAQAHPRAAANLGAAYNIASLYPMAKAAAGVSSLKQGIEEGLSKSRFDAIYGTGKDVADYRVVEHPWNPGKVVPIYTGKSTSKFIQNEIANIKSMLKK